MELDPWAWDLGAWRQNQARKKMGPGILHQGKLPVRQIGHYSTPASLNE